MTKVSLLRKLIFAAAGGLAGLFVLLIADGIVLAVVIPHMFGSSLSVWENLIILGLVPVLIIFGTSIPTWVLGAPFKRGLLSGMIAMGAIALILVYGGPNYSPFNNRETLEFVSPVCISVLMSSAFRKDRISMGKLAIFILTFILFGLKLVIPEDEFRINGIDFKVGFAISLITWFILPSATVFFTKMDGNE
jgi:hypothetical protein